MLNVGCITLAYARACAPSQTTPKFLMKFQISRREFESIFGSSATSFYKEFIEKVNTELEAKVHSAATIETLRPISNWRDAGNNTHVRLSGQIKFLHQQGDINGEFVWLKNLKKFRGKICSSLSLSSDAQLLLEARQAFRSERYEEARDFLNAIENIDILPRSAIFLKTVIHRKLK